MVIKLQIELREFQEFQPKIIQNNSKRICISPEEKLKVFDSLRLILLDVINLLDNTPIEPFKFRTKACVKINDGLRGTYNEDN